MSGSGEKLIGKNGFKRFLANISDKLFRSGYRVIQPLFRFPCRFAFIFVMSLMVTMQVWHTDVRAEDDSWLSQGVIVVKALQGSLASF